MSSPTIDIGIDLGTSNSAVAVANEGEVEVIRNNDNDQITPSVVRFLPNRAVQVGRKAYEHFRLVNDDSSFGRFKRKMGKQETYRVSSTGDEVTPESLASELLKSLRADAESFTGHSVRAAVITVPAMFELAQCLATQRAAALAGIDQAPLLQEPIAAGLAYGYERDLSDAYFLVYDLGGGTFDVTLMKVSEGSLAVVDVTGDNFLGSRDWDRRLAGLLAQRLIAAGFQLWSREEPPGQEFVGRLELLAEQEKIQLSRREQVDVVFDGQLHDATGRPIEISIPVSRAEYEQLIALDVERSIDLLHGLVQRQNLPASAIAHILLVGGPTRTPLLRRMVSSLTGISPETRIDPMTVVAEGAARFAASVIGDEQPSTAVTPGALTRLNLSYPKVTDDVIAHVGGRVEDTPDGDLSVEIRRADGGWSSGRIPVQGGVFFTTVALLSRRPNSFEIICFDQAGRTVPVTPDRLSVTRGLMAAEPPLARAVGVAVLDVQNKEIRYLMFQRGTALPAVARATFRTTRTVSPGRSENALKIHVFEGEFERPSINRHVGYLSITGDRLNRILPANTPIEVTMRIDTSRRATVSAYVPLLDETFEEILADVVLPEEDPRQIGRDLDDDLTRARQAVGTPQEIARLDAIAREIREDIAAAVAGDIERADRADRRRKELANEVDQLAKRAEVPGLIEEVNTALANAQQMANDHGDAAQRNRLALIRSEAEAAIDGGRPDDLQRVRDECYRLQWQIVWELPSFWVDHYIHLSEVVEGGGYADQAAPLLRQGRAALDRQDMDELRAVCRQLWDLLPQAQRDASGLPDIGIRV